MNSISAHRSEQASGQAPVALQAIERVCKPGRTVNEDRLGIGRAAAWVIDGATGIRPKQLLPGASDAAWLAASIDRELARQLGTEHRATLSTGEALRDVSREVVRAFSLECSAPAGVADGPSAGMAIARVAGVSLELINLGDCRILYRQGKEVRAFGSSNVAAFDRKVVEELVRLREEKTLAYSEAWPALREIIRSNRDWINVPGGYWIFDLSERWIDHLQVATLPLDMGETTVLLMSDGFYRLVDTFHAYTDASLFAAAQSAGLESLYDELRRIERADTECVRHPRIKPSDDASALLLRVAAVGP